MYNILTKFDLLIRDKFKFNMHNNPTLSSLAFSIYRYKYIPEILNLRLKLEDKYSLKV